MRNNKTYNIIITRDGEVVKEIHTNDCMYAWRRITGWYEDEYGNRYIDRQYDEFHIKLGSGKNITYDKLVEDCWRNGHLSVK